MGFFRKQRAGLTDRQIDEIASYIDANYREEAPCTELGDLPSARLGALEPQVAGLAVLELSDAGLPAAEPASADQVTGSFAPLEDACPTTAPCASDSAPAPSGPEGAREAAVPAAPSGPESAWPAAASAPAPTPAPAGRIPAACIPARSLQDAVARTQETFSQMLLRTIDEKGLADPAVYKRARIDRKLFSKIRSNPRYQPSKATAVALALALELSLDETLDLIGRAGYTLTHASKGDIVVEYFIGQRCWDVQLINEALYAFGQPLVGA